MLKLKIFCCALVLIVAEATELEDHCIIAYLKQRSLLNSTTFSNYRAPVRTKNCDQIVRKIARSVYEDNFDYLEEGASVDNETYKDCLRSEFNVHKMDEKFLKAKLFYEDGEPGADKLEVVKDNMLTHIKRKCSKSIVEEASERFKSFVTDKGGPAYHMARHPAILKIKSNIICMNRYAVEKNLLDPTYYNLKLKLINQTPEYCEKVVEDVTALIMDEWHIRRQSEDDEIQRCLIEIWLEAKAVDVFIKNTLLSQLYLSQEQKDYERETFIESSNNVHELSYKCMSIGFEKI